MLAGAVALDDQHEARHAALGHDLSQHLRRRRVDYLGFAI